MSEFSSNLAYEPVRAETFWGYYRGMNPLFDDLFSGQGVFLVQQVSSPGDASKARKVYDKAFCVNPADARLLFERDQLWKRLGEKSSPGRWG